MLAAEALLATEVAARSGQPATNVSLAEIRPIEATQPQSHKDGGRSSWHRKSHFVWASDDQGSATGESYHWATPNNIQGEASDLRRCWNFCSNNIGDSSRWLEYYYFEL